jgi:hypothetical protein
MNPPIEHSLHSLAQFTTVQYNTKQLRIKPREVVPHDCL